MPMRQRRLARHRVRVSGRRFAVRQEADEPPEPSPWSVSVSGIRPDALQRRSSAMCFSASTGASRHRATPVLIMWSKVPVERLDRARLHTSVRIRVPRSSSPRLTDRSSAIGLRPPSPLLALPRRAALCLGSISKGTRPGPLHALQLLRFSERCRLDRARSAASPPR